MQTQEKISVMIVDDSTVYRQLLRNVLSEDNEIEVISQAVNGKLAIPRLKHYKPDIIILDYEMPEMTGIEFLTIVKQEFPDIAVIMFSSYTVEGAKITIEALQKGALDFVTKPDFSIDGNAEEYVRKHIITKIKAIARRNKMKFDSLQSSKLNTYNVISNPITANKFQSVGKGSYLVFGIGISTGGPIALRKLFSCFKKNLNGSILIVQHMPPIFTKQLAESLSEICPVKVVEGEENMVITPNYAYIAPGGKHMIITSIGERKIIKIIDDPPEESCKPSVNILFRSIAKEYGNKAAAAIMTGMGNDGYRGMVELQKTGSYLVAQSQESCLIFGMPHLPIKENLVSEILNIEGIAAKVESSLGVN